MNNDVGVAEIQHWTAGLDEIEQLIGPRFTRSEPRANAMSYIRGLLSDTKRKNSWTLSEHAGQPLPDPLQRLLSSTDWDPDTVRDDLLGYVADHLGAPGGVLIVNETEFIKKGTRSAGVARQYTGTAGRIENSQVGVFLTYASIHGRTFVDRELYLPKAWTEDSERCARAGISETRVGTGFVTKPELAARMIDRAIAAGMPALWVSGDAVYGATSTLRHHLEDAGLLCVLAVPSNQHVIAKQTRTLAGGGYRVAELVAGLPGTSWRTRSAGTGSKGPRMYSWARVRANSRDPGTEFWVLARKNLADPQEVVCHLCHSPRRVSLTKLVEVAGVRWAIEETFQSAKGQTALDHYQVRTHTGWYKHITLSMFAHAFLTVTRKNNQQDERPKRKGGRTAQQTPH